MADAYLVLLVVFQVIFLFGSLVFVVAFAFSARDAGRARRAENITIRANRFLHAVQSLAVSIALFFFFWGFNIGSGMALAAVPLSAGWRVAYLIFMMAFWLACAFRLAWAWNKLQRVIRYPPDG